ncbi:adenylylsulfate kinase [Serratia symbiotica str. 'Cinara cedri']|nr:adenylylsulfate kinase [Serratia symbiotica str. 'Cinara cedri']
MHAIYLGASEMAVTHLQSIQPKNKNIVWHPHRVTRVDREVLNGHKSALLWFTGLSGSGKSTVAGALEQALYALGVSTYLLDGDNVRHGLCSDLSFSVTGRHENIRRVGEVVKLMVDAGLVVITAFISPYHEERQKIRTICDMTCFIEVFVDTPLEVCEARDPKGLYKKARAGDLRNFTGIDAVFETPQQPDIHLNGQQLVTDSIAQLLYILRDRAIIKR